MIMFAQIDTLFRNIRYILLFDFNIQVQVRCDADKKNTSLFSTHLKLVDINRCQAATHERYGTSFY